MTANTLYAFMCDDAFHPVDYCDDNYVSFRSAPLNIRVDWVLYNASGCEGSSKYPLNTQDYDKFEIKYRGIHPDREIELTPREELVCLFSYGVDNTLEVLKVIESRGGLPFSRKFIYKSLPRMNKYDIAAIFYDLKELHFILPLRGGYLFIQNPNCELEWKK